MPVVKNMMVRAGADFSAITRESKKAENSMSRMAGTVDKSCQTIKRALSALGIGFSVAAIVRAGKAAAEAYDKQAEAEMKLARVMRNTMHASNGEIQSILDLAEAQQKLGIVGDEIQIAGAQELATYLKLSDSLQTLIPVMNDMAVQQYGYNVTAEETTTIATMLGKVMSGQVSALSRYGYYFDEAQAKVLKFGTESERAAMLAQVVEQSVGGMNAALAATPTGRMKQLNNTLGDIKEKFGQAVRTIGTAFLPLLNTVAKVLAAIATLFNKVAQTIANVFGGTVAGKEWEFLPSSAVGVVSDATDATDDLTASTKKAAQAAKEANEEYQQASFDTLHILNENNKQAAESGSEDVYTPPASEDTGSLIRETDTGSTSSGESIGWLEKLLKKLKEKWEDFKSGLDFTKLKEGWNTLKDAVKGFAEAVGGVFNSVWERILKPFGQWTINEALPAVLGVLAGVFDVLAAAINKVRPAFEWLWDNFLEKIAKWAGDMFIKALDEIAEQLHNIARVINGDMSLGEFIAQLDPLEKVLLAIGAAILGIKVAMLAVKAVNFVSHIAESVAGLGKVVGTIASADSLSGGLVAAFGAVKTTLAGIGGVIGGLTLAVSGFVEAWQNGSKWITTAIEAIGLAIAAVGAIILGAPAAVAAAVAAVVFVIANAAADIHSHWDEIKEKGKEVVESVKGFFISGIEDIKADASALIESTKASFSELREAGAAIWDGVKAAGQAAAEGIHKAFDSAVQSVAASLNALKIHFDEVKDAANKAVDALKLAWSGIGEWFKTNVSEPIIQWGKEAWESIQKWGSDAAQVIRERWTGVKEQLVGMWQSVEAAGKSAWETVKKHALSAWSEVCSAWGRSKIFFEENVFQPLVDSARRGVEKIKNVFSGVAEAVGQAISKIKEGIKKAVSIADQLPSGFSLKNMTVSGLIDKLKSIKLPGLAEGAVIPPNRRFAAVLGDQTSGFNIETPERLLRQIVRDELSAVAAGRTDSPSELMSGAVREGSSTARVMRMLDKILEAIEDGHSLAVDGYAIGYTARRNMAMQARARG